MEHFERYNIRTLQVSVSVSVSPISRCQYRRSMTADGRSNEKIRSLDMSKGSSFSLRAYATTQPMLCNNQ